MPVYTIPPVQHQIGKKSYVKSTFLGLRGSALKVGSLQTFVTDAEYEHSVL